MTLTQIVFILFAAITLLTGLFCVTTRNMFHAALYLVISLFGVAAMFAMLDASFLAAAQLIVYVGAVAILIIFAVMLTRGGAGSLPAKRQFNTQAGSGRRGHGGDAVHPAARGAVLQLSRASRGRADRYSEQLGLALVGDFVLPFEVASVLLLAALIGAIYIARERRKGEEVEEG